MLKVSMYDTCYVNIAETLGDLRDYLTGFIFGKLVYTLVVQVADEVAALTELGYDVRLILDFEFLNELYDILTALARRHSFTF